MYSATSQFGHHLNTGTLNMTENVVSLDKKLIFFLGQRTFSCTRAKSHKFPYVVNPAVRSLLICELYMTELPVKI